MFTDCQYFGSTVVMVRVEVVIDGEFDFRGTTVPHEQSSQDIDK